MQKITIPDDNDCLFSTFSCLTTEDSSYSPKGNAALRSAVADAVGADPQTWAEWRLGMPTADYQTWIQNQFNWGGENEIVILGRKFNMEVCVVSMESFSTLVYGQDIEDRTGRVYILYTGQHYEPLVGESGQRVWPLGADPATEAACVEVARAVAAEKARQASQRKKTVLKCGGCGALCDDTDAFQVHCEQVEHDDDFMYDCESVEVVIEADESLDPDAIDLSDQSTMALYNHPSQPLANASPGFVISINDVSYPSAHHYWLCAQYFDSGEDDLKRTLREKILAAESSNDAEQLALYTNCTPVQDWDASGRKEAALVAMRAKFKQHSQAWDLLEATGEKKLVFLDQDTWAGVDNTGGIPKGRNVLGECLMQIRSELRE